MAWPQLMAVGITAGLDIIPQPGLFLSLKDDAGTLWSIRFKSEEDLYKATCAVALARSTDWTAEPGGYFLVQQDAIVGQEVGLLPRQPMLPCVCVCARARGAARCPVTPR